MRVPGYLSGYNPDLMTFTRVFNHRRWNARDFMPRPTTDDGRDPTVFRGVRDRGNV
jgi:hypothetical protein